MPSTGGRKFGRKGAQGPDTIDIASLFDVFYTEWGLTPWVSTTVALDGNLMIEATAEGKRSDDKVFTYHVARVFNPNVDNIIHIMLQVMHALYHRIDRDPLMSKIESDV